MAIQLRDTVQAAMLDAVETTIGASPIFEIRTGAPPAAITDADSGTLLASIALPSDWMANASGNNKEKLGTWEDSSADASGNAGHFRIKVGPDAFMQGTITASGGGGDATMPSVAITAAEPVIVNAFSLQFP